MTSNDEGDGGLSDMSGQILADRLLKKYHSKKVEGAKQDTVNPGLDLAAFKSNDDSIRAIYTLHHLEEKYQTKMTEKLTEVQQKISTVQRNKSSRIQKAKDVAKEEQDKVNQGLVAKRKQECDAENERGLNVLHAHAAIEAKLRVRHRKSLKVYLQIFLQK
jgi:hypothetical protein